MASRVEIPFTVEKIVSSNLQPAAASVQVNVRGGGATLVYSTESGGTTLSNPLTTDANGRIEGWVNEGSYDLVISGAGFTTYTQPWEAIRSDILLSIATARIADGAITSPKLASSAVATANIANAAVTLAKAAPDLVAGQNPPGAILTYAGSTAPAGYLLCDGSSKLISSYGALYAVIGTTYGGSGGNFNVPDLRGRVAVGPDNMGSGAANRLTANKALGNSGGEEKHTLTIPEIPAHGHQVPQRINSGSGPFDDGSHVPYVSRTPNFDALSASTGDAGGGGSHNTMQPFVILNAIIKT